MSNQLHLIKNAGIARDSQRIISDVSKIRRNLTLHNLDAKQDKALVMYRSYLFTTRTYEAALAGFYGIDAKLEYRKFEQHENVNLQNLQKLWRDSYRSWRKAMMDLRQQPVRMVNDNTVIATPCPICNGAACPACDYMGSL